MITAAYSLLPAPPAPEPPAKRYASTPLSTHPLPPPPNPSHAIPAPKPAGTRSLCQCPPTASAHATPSLPPSGPLRVRVRLKRSLVHRTCRARMRHTRVLRSSASVSARPALLQPLGPAPRGFSLPACEKVNSAGSSLPASGCPFLLPAASSSLFQVLCGSWRYGGGKGSGERRAAGRQANARYCQRSAQATAGNNRGHARWRDEAAQFSDARGSRCFSSAAILFKG